MEPVKYPIDGILDLHLFDPRDVDDLVAEYLRVCRQRDVTRVRIIHGKGKGILRRRVHALLEQHPDVVSYRLATDESGWGATMVELAAEPE